MTLATPGAPLTVTLTASSINTTIYVSSADYTVETKKFDRKEFSNTFLMNLSEEDGSFPVWIKNAVGKPIQLNFNCGDYTARNPLPDNLNLNSIQQTMIVKTYTLQGSPTAPSAIDSVFTVARDHKVRLGSFDAYLDRFGLTLSYLYFYNTMRAINFSYLTSTGLTLSGGELMSESNCLIRQFNPGILHTNPTNSSITTKSWSMTVDVISIQTANIY